MLLTGKMQRENLGAVLAGRGRCLLEYHQQALWADTERECDGGVGFARGKGLTGENTQGRKDKRQSTNQLNTQASLDGFETTKPGEEEEGGRRRTMLVEMTNGWKKSRMRLRRRFEVGRGSLGKIRKGVGRQALEQGKVGR